MCGGLNVRIEKRPDTYSSGLTGKFAILDLGLDVVAVHKSDEIETDFLGACFVTFAMVGARTKEAFHGFDHGLGAFKTLRLPLWDEVEMSELGGGEELCSGVRASCYAGSATDAGRGVERSVRSFFRYRSQVRI